MKRTMLLVASVAVPALLSASVSYGADPAVERMFKGKCAACHGADGKGQTTQGQKMKIRDMTTAAYKKEVTEAKAKEAIEKGVSREKDGVKQEMKGFAGKLTPEQIDSLVKYVHDLK